MLVAALLVGFLLASLLVSGEASQTIAAWAQFFAALVGLFAVFAVARFSADENRKLVIQLQNEKEQIAVKKIMAFHNLISLQVFSIKTSVKGIASLSAENRKNWKETFQAYASGLEDFKCPDMPEADSAVALVGLKNCVRTLISNMEFDIHFDLVGVHKKFIDDLEWSSTHLIYLKDQFSRAIDA